MRLALLAGGDGWHVRDLVRAAIALGHTAQSLDFRRISSYLACPLDPGAGFDAIHVRTMPPGSIVARRSTAGPAAERRATMAFAGFDAVLVRTMPPGSLEQVVFRMDVLHLLEARGIPVLNPPRSLEVCVDKYLASARLESAGLPVPPTAVCQDADTAMEAFTALGGDVVVKPLFGSEGRGMVRVSDPELAWRTFRTLERTQSVLYVQQFIAHPGWDLRAFVLGGRVLTAMRRHARDGWRTNIAQGGKGEVIALSADEECLALRAAEAVGVPVAGVDLLPGPDGNLFVLEVNAVPGWRALAPVTGVDVAVEMIRFLTTRYTPVAHAPGSPGPR